MSLFPRPTLTGPMHSPECRWLYLLPGVEQFLNPQLRCAGLIDLQGSEMGVTESHGLGGAAHSAAGLQEDLDAALWSSTMGLPGGGRVAVAAAQCPYPVSCW